MTDLTADMLTELNRQLFQDAGVFEVSVALHSSSQLAELHEFLVAQLLCGTKHGEFIRVPVLGPATHAALSAYLDGQWSYTVRAAGVELPHEGGVGSLPQADSGAGRKKGPRLQPEALDPGCPHPVGKAAPALHGTCKADKREAAKKEKHTKAKRLRQDRATPESHDDEPEPEAENPRTKEPWDSDSHDTVVIENLAEAWPHINTIGELQKIVLAFALFHTVESVFVPLQHGPRPVPRAVAFLAYAKDHNTTQDLLRALYHLDGLTPLQMAAFTAADIDDSLMETSSHPEPDKPGQSSVALRVVIGQKKHNHNLFTAAAAPYIGFRYAGAQTLHHCEPLPIPELYEKYILARLCKYTNYQELNIYVNNLPVLFNNDDDLWLAFWNQFARGGIKSARIIKPQFYSKALPVSCGKFGFVFYEHFKMALRAILLTNNRRVTVAGQTVVIRASFAIQKRSLLLALRPPPAFSYPFVPRFVPDKFPPLGLVFVPPMDGGSYTVNPYMVPVPYLEKGFASEVPAAIPYGYFYYPAVADAPPAT